MTAPYVDDLEPEAHSAALAEVAPMVVQLLLDMEASGALTPTSLTLPAETEYDTYAAFGRFLGELHKRTAWYIGDWLIFGEGTYGERYAQAASETGLSRHTLQNRIWVCGSIPPSRRRPELSFSTHVLVAGMKAREQRSWLARAVENGWTRAELDDQIRAAKALDRGGDEPGELPPGGRGVHPGLLLEAAQSIVRNAEVAGENVIVRREDFARLLAALGEEE